MLARAREPYILLCAEVPTASMDLPGGHALLLGSTTAGPSFEASAERARPNKTSAHTAEDGIWGKRLGNRMK
jgi:hypothetical protein